MSSYTLTITLTVAQVNDFHNSNNQIMLAKSSSAGGAPNVIWLALPPMQNNVVAWDEQYGLYFSVQPFPPGTGMLLGSDIIINGSVAAPIAGQELYTLLGNNTIAGPGSSQGPAGTYSLLNSSSSSSSSNSNSRDTVVVGLTQAATVNGTPILKQMPILADALMQGQTDTISTSPEVYIWAQSPGGLANFQVQLVTGGNLLLPFGSSDIALSVTYNSDTGMFELSTDS